MKTAQKNITQIKKYLVVAIIVFAMTLCLMLGYVGYQTYAHGIIQRYEATLFDASKTALAALDTDELERCVATGEVNEGYKNMQNRLNSIKTTHSVEFIYAVIPLNNNATANMKYVITGIEDWEYRDLPDELKTLGDLSKDEFTPDTMHYYEEVMSGRKESIFYNNSSYFGDIHTLLVPVRNSKNEIFCVLATDVTIKEIRQNKMRYLVVVASVSAALMVIFLFIMLAWLKKKVTDPIEALEKANEKARRQAEEASRIKTDFLFNMSHDIRTPMNAIIGFTELGKKHCDDPQLVKGYFEKIDVSGNHLLELINEVLDMSRIEAGKIQREMKKVNVIAEAEKTLVIYHEASNMKNIELVLDCDRIEHPCVEVDKLHVNQIVMNLLGNALKYTQNGGKVVFTIEEEESDKPGCGRYRFIIEDNGIGMSKEFLASIYDAFSREENENVSSIQGTGLGMSIVKRLVDAMEGTIDVQSEQGIGTKVTVVLNMSIVDSIDEDENSDITSQVDLAGRRVLVVEDNELNREIVHCILTEQGMLVDEAKDGREAVNMVSEKGARYYECVLMDIKMPVMDGYEASATIRQLPDSAGLPIIALSANAFEEDRNKAIEAGMNDHVAKPFKLDELLEKLRKYVSEASR